MLAKKNLGEFDEEEDIDLSNELTGIDETVDLKDLDIQTVQTTLDIIIKRLKKNEIALSPDFQCNAGLGETQYMSRIIESLLIRFPIPAFYFDGTNDKHWQVMDGLQRLSTVKAFVLDKTLKLEGLEFLPQFEGAAYDELPRNWQRRISEAQVTMFVINPGVPINVKFSLFHRVNTGGFQLSSQEVRHALSQEINEGRASGFLKKITETPAFKGVVKVTKDRKLDQELVLRHIALKWADYQNYKPPMISFLNAAMEQLGQESEEDLELLETNIVRVMKLAKKLFGEDAFRKSIAGPEMPKAINRALFETVSVLLADLNGVQIKSLLTNKEEFLKEFIELFEDKKFFASITKSTTSSKNLKARFSKISAVINTYSK